MNPTSNLTDAQGDELQCIYTLQRVQQQSGVVPRRKTSLLSIAHYSVNSFKEKVILNERI